VGKYKRPRLPAQPVGFPPRPTFDPNHPVIAEARRLAEQLNASHNHPALASIRRLTEQLNASPEWRKQLETINAGPEWRNQHLCRLLMKWCEGTAELDYERVRPYLEAEAAAQAAKQPAKPKHPGGRKPLSEADREYLCKLAQPLLKQRPYRDSEDALAKELRSRWQRERPKEDLAPSTSTIKRHVTGQFFKT
jgi:hypothetical protein